MARPDIMLAFGKKPAPADDEPDGDEEAPEGEDYGSDAEDQACAELADLLGIPEEKHDDFKEALGAFIDARMSKGEP